MDVESITDAADPRLDDFRDLTDADVRPDRRGIVIAEGVNVVERMVGSPYRMRAVVGVASRLDALRPALAQRDAPAYAVDKWLLSEVVGFRVTRGVLASADRPPALDAAELVAAARRIAVLEGLNDFENLGSLFRNAAAFGVDAVLLDPTCADPLYRRSVRVSMGHVLRIPFAVLPGAWPGALDLLRGHGVTTLALTPRGERPLRELAAPDRWAVLLGAEGPGLAAATLAAADERVRIPMVAGVDSLNVATAAAVAFAQLC
ncbi:tRNA G18 (ribose-2'-O)-methylase SpoU [Jatrophihabitans endophyticus]|uniref:tRNA G18 (Ribose-2'-O)-methylase SpoU n=1 Tax=Jatrophihabitans endophyticus TaxID=1206085 RepID=A0A1M5RHN4_9ACTN|nr:RNA methyltransferase [Jatrophihabitans endophyticus]SHH25825.1 tRNA G18 (ribose-2'-O)-methylase SpoU [Jatrophihabitans endophyticus]